MTTSTAYAAGLNHDDTSYTGFNIVSQIIASDLTAPSGTPTFIQLVLKGCINAGAKSTAIDDMRIGHKATVGDAYDFSATPFQVTVAGATSFTVPAGGTLTTDAIPFVWDKISDILAAFHMVNSTAADSLIRKTTGTAGSVYAIATSADDAPTVNKSGYSASGFDPNTEALIDQIIMDGYGGTPVSTTTYGTTSAYAWADTGLGNPPLTTVIPKSNTGASLTVGYSIDLSGMLGGPTIGAAGIAIGDQIKAYIEMEGTNAGDIASMCTYIAWGSSPSDTTGKPISGNDGTNVDNSEIHHQTSKQFGVGVITNITTQRYVNLIAYSECFTDHTNDFTFEGVNYGRLYVERQR